MNAKEAIKDLFEQYSADVYRYARLMLGDESDARDVVQEVFFRAYCSWSGYRKESQPKTWLMTITRNCVFTLYRKKKQESDFLRSYHPLHTSHPSVSPETAAILEDALSQLKDSYRQVMILRQIEGLSVKESAQVLGWSESKVKMTDKRAMQKLRDILGFDSEEVTKKREPRQTQS